MKFFKYSLLLSTSLFLNFQNSWAMDSDEFTDLRGLSQKTKFYNVAITAQGETRFTQCRYGTGISVSHQEENTPRKFLVVQSIDNQCEIIAESDDPPVKAENVINGVDKRKKKENTTKLPHRFHGQMIMTFPNGKQYTGSGTMVGPHQVLTAGHNLHSIANGGWATSVRFIPGRNENQQPYGEVKGKILLSPQKWTIERNMDHDYGMVILDKDIGRQTGWAGMLTSPDDDELKNMDIYVSGYPGDKGATQLWSIKGNPSSLDSNTISYGLATAPGQSGSGVFTKDKKELYNPNATGYYVLGIHAYGSEVSNFATRITGEIFDKLIHWMQDPYMSPPTCGITHITSNSAWDGVIDSTQEDGLTKILTHGEKKQLREDRTAHRRLLKQDRDALKDDPDYNPKADPNYNDTEPARKHRKRLATITQATPQVDRMVEKGIIASNRINEAGNLKLLTKQVVDAKIALEKINTFLADVLKKAIDYGKPTMTDQEKTEIRVFHRKYMKFNELDTLEVLVSRDKSVCWLIDYFRNPANETLSLCDRTRYVRWTKDTQRKDQIETSQQANVPVRHRATATANFVRLERALELQDELLIKGFELQKRWRRPKASLPSPSGSQS